MLNIINIPTYSYIHVASSSPNSHSQSSSKSQELASLFGKTTQWKGISSLPGDRLTFRGAWCRRRVSRCTKKWGTVAWRAVAKTREAWGDGETFSGGWWWAMGAEEEEEAYMDQAKLCRFSMMRWAIRRTSTRGVTCMKKSPDAVHKCLTMSDGMVI